MRDYSFDSLEEKIQIAAESSRFRLQEFFIDYDRLRSGYVTKSQFHRVLDQMLKGSLSPEQIDFLADKYDLKNNSTVNYKAFLESVNKPFSHDRFIQDPSNHVYKNPEYLGTLRSMEQLSADEEARLKQLLSHLNNYFSKRSIDILASFRDFDRNNIGTVTESQFRRISTDLPISEEEIRLLLRKYHQPETKNLVNYLNFYNEFKTSFDKQNSVSNFSTYVPFSAQNPILSIQEIVDKISIACFKAGIRISDFFKDYDRLRSGQITDRQFSTALTDSVKKSANLSLDDINQLIEYYRQQDGKCDYKTFCDTIENGFNIPDLVKKPLSNVLRPPKGLLSKALNGNLLPDEEEAVHRIIEELSEKVRKYNIQVFPFFKDFDRSTAFTRNITKLQFGRVLASLNIMPAEKDYYLLCKKFEDPVSGDLNYPAFCQVIDENFTHSKIDDLKLNEENFTNKQIKLDHLPTDTTSVDLNELLARIRSHVLSNRIRIKEFFQDMDPLNSGHVTKSQFIRCLSSFGISSIGSFPINKAQTEALCNQYKSSSDSSKCSWKKFEDDVESVFTLRNLEKNPTALVRPTETFLMPPPGTVSWSDEDLSSSENYKIALEHVKNIVNQRRIDCWSPFRDFDKLNRGHVTRKQFHQCLSKLNIPLSETHATVLEVKYANNLGFNYIDFLNQIQPALVDELKYHAFKKELELLNSNKQANDERNPCNDVQSILVKIKDQVYRKRVSIYEWLRDHDKLNSGRMPRETFRRALNLCNLDLQSCEIEMLMNYYNSKRDNLMVEYKDFCHEIETAFVGKEHLEKNPLVEADQHKLKDVVQTNKLLADEEDLAHNSMQTLAKRVRAQRMQLFPKFEDFDRVKIGNLSQNQFRRVLNDLNLLSLINEQELAAIMKKYFVRIGTRDDVNYIKFCDHIYELGSFESRKP